MFKEMTIYLGRAIFAVSVAAANDEINFSRIGFLFPTFLQTRQHKVVRVKDAYTTETLLRDCVFPFLQFSSTD